MAPATCGLSQQHGVPSVPGSTEKTQRPEEWMSGGVRWERPVREENSSALTKVLLPCTGDEGLSVAQKLQKANRRVQLISGELLYGKMSTSRTHMEDLRDAQQVRVHSSCRGPEFGSQHPLGGLQLPIIPAPRDLMASSGLLGHLHTYTHTHPQRHTHKQNLK